MLVDERPHRRRVEEAAIARSGPEDELVEHGPEFPAKPAADRNRESHLPARQNFRRHEVSDRRSKNGLRPPPTQLEA